MRWTAFALILSLSLLGSRESPGAESPLLDPLSPAAAGQRHVVSLTEGERAPFAGELLDVETAIRLGVRASQCDERLSAELRRAHRLAEIELTSERDLRALNERAAQEREELLRQEIAEAHAWYREPLFVGPLAAVATALVVLLARETIVDVR